MTADPRTWPFWLLALIAYGVVALYLVVACLTAPYDNDSP